MTDEIETDEPVKLNNAYLKAQALQLQGDSADIVEILRRSSFRQIADQIHALNPLPYGGYDNWVEVDSSGRSFGTRPEFPPTEADAMYGYPFADLTVEEYDRQVAEETALQAMEAEIEADLATLEAEHQLDVDAIKSRRYLHTEMEKARRSDLKYAAFDEHQKQCQNCQRTFEFWCDEGVALMRKVKYQ